METIQKRRLDSEMFGENGRHYFIDLLKARNDKPYLQITRSDTAGENKYDRSTIILFERDFEFFIEALSMVMTRYSHGEGRTA
jgi:hypothetical protein